MQHKFSIDAMDVNSSFLLRDILYSELNPIIKSKRPIIFICIGTDRSTGDSLGPLVGHKLKFVKRKGIEIYGTLENPVHAKNLTDVLSNINSIYNNPYIVAIDACLGSLQNIGKIFIESKPLYPGTALNKDLPPVGELSITGIVNISGSLEFMVLQNTRLFTVMQLADTIAQGIYHCVLKIVGGRKSSANDFNVEELLVKTTD